jgi:hypothetical protein
MFLFKKIIDSLLVTAGKGLTIPPHPRRDSIILLGVGAMKVVPT